MHSRRAFAALAAAGTLWGTGFVFGKWALEELSVGHMLLYRFAFAALGLVPVAWNSMRRGPAPVDRRDISTFLIAALFGVPLQFIVQFEGLRRTTVSHASLMVGILPALLGGGAAFLGERVSASRWAALGASVLGACLIAVGATRESSSGGPTVAGDCLVVASLLLAVVWMLLSQRLMNGARRYPPVITSAYVLILGALMLALWVIAREGLPPTSLRPLTWISVMAQGLLATALTTVLWNYGLARIPASQAGVFVNLEPVVGAVLGLVLFGDRLGILAAFGGVLVVGSAVAVTRSTEPS
jgi:drug/metabolite transporter (DMT)-like permease